MKTETTSKQELAKREARDRQLAESFNKCMRLMDEVYRKYHPKK
jgi:hypothetical protein